MSTLDQILDCLEGVQETTNGWQARCPAHEDQHPSLSIAERNGNVLLNCHAGCSIERICESLGITRADLFSAPTSTNLHGSPKDSRNCKPCQDAKPKKGFSSRDQAATAMARAANGSVENVWTYEDADGRHVFSVVRIETAKGKTFRPVYESGGAWNIGDPPGELPLYRLPELCDANRVYVTEGEKAADAARSVGLVATTSAHGSKSAKKSDWSSLAGKDVIIFPDNDVPGRKYADEIVSILATLDPSPSVWIVALPDLPAGGDIVDWIEARGDAAKPDDLSREIERLVGAAEPAQLTQPPQASLPTTSEEATSDADPWPDDLGAEAYYGLAGEIVKAIEPHSEADPVALLVQLLIAFGNLVGRSAFFVAEADRHCGNLFTTLVGTTSKGRKGSSWGQIRRMMDFVVPDWCLGNVVSGLSSGEGLIWAVRDEVVKQEPIREGSKRIGTITGYQDVMVDPGVSDKRLLVLEGEFASVLQVCAREKNTLSAIIRQAWDTGDLRSLAKNSPAQATGSHISIVGHITRQELRRLITATDLANGMANRFLWLCVRRSKALPEGGHLRDEDLMPLADRLRDAVEFSQQVGEIKRDADARLIWHGVYAELSAGKPGLLGAATSRAESQVMRLAMLYSLLDRSRAIRKTHLMAGLALWTYAEQSARYIFGSATGDPVADEILAHLRSGDEGLTRSQIRDLFSRHQPKDRINEALDSLRNDGLIRSKRTETGGRPVETFFACA